MSGLFGVYRLFIGSFWTQQQWQQQCQFWLLRLYAKTFIDDKIIYTISGSSILINQNACDEIIFDSLQKKQ